MGNWSFSEFLLYLFLFHHYVIEYKRHLHVKQFATNLKIFTISFDCFFLHVFAQIQFFAHFCKTTSNFLSLIGISKPLFSIHFLDHSKSWLTSSFSICFLGLYYSGSLVSFQYFRKSSDCIVLEFSRLSKICLAFWLTQSL